MAGVDCVINSCSNVCTTSEILSLALCTQCKTLPVFVSITCDLLHPQYIFNFCWPWQGSAVCSKLLKKLKTGGWMTKVLKISVWVPAVRTAVTVYSKILLNSRLFYSKHAKRVNKCNSFTVTYSDPLYETIEKFISYPATPSSVHAALIRPVEVCKCEFLQILIYPWEVAHVKNLFVENFVSMCFDASTKDDSLITTIIVEKPSWPFVYYKCMLPWQHSVSIVNFSLYVYVCGPVHGKSVCVCVVGEVGWS